MCPVVVMREVGSSPIASLTGTPSWLKRAAISVTAVAPDECPTKILARGLFRQARPRQIIVDGGVDAMLLQLGGNLVHAQREHVREAAKQINVRTRLRSGCCLGVAGANR